ARIRIAEDLDAAQADRRGDAIAVRIEVLHGLVPDLVEVHLDAVDDRQKRVARDRECSHGLRQPRRDWIRGAAARLVAERDVTTPAFQRAPLVRAIGAALASEVGDIVHRPAEGVHGVQRVPAPLGEREERVVEVRAALAGQTGRQMPDHAIFLASVTYPCSTNQSAASRSASRTSVRGSPSSRSALAALKNMRLRAIRTAVSDARGAPPVTRAATSMHPAASQATAYGIRTRGARLPAISASKVPISARVRFALPRMYFSPTRPRSAARRCPRATSRTWTRLRPVASVANILPWRKSTIIRPVGVGLTSHGPTGGQGFTIR